MAADEKDTVDEIVAAEHVGLHTLAPAPGSRRPRKRVGRGEGSGTGKTAGRGQKGYGSRAGAKDRARFEGGQNPIHMRMRKLRGPEGLGPRGGRKGPRPFGGGPNPDPRGEAKAAGPKKKVAVPVRAFPDPPPPRHPRRPGCALRRGGVDRPRHDEGRRPRHPPG